MIIFEYIITNFDIKITTHKAYQVTVSEFITKLKGDLALLHVIDCE